MRSTLISLTFFVAAVSFANSSCSSEPLSQGAPSGGATNAGGRGGTGGAGTPGGKGPLGPVQDYSQSPCYGQPGTTEVYDGKTHLVSELAGSCRAEGERVRLYVADELFGSVVQQPALNRFMHRYEVEGSSPAHPELGVLETDEAIFGDLPSADLPDGKLDVWVLDTHGAGEGYLCSWCEIPQLHLDGFLLSPLDGDKAMAIAAHESFHIIHRAYDADETIWIDETLAEAAMTANGFFTDKAWLASFLKNPNVNWGPGVETIADFNYGAGLLFGTFLWEKGGAELLRAITIQPKNSWEGLDAALGASALATTGRQAFLDMAVAAYFDDPARGWGFRSFDLEGGIARSRLEAGASADVAVRNHGLVYYELADDVRAFSLEANSDVLGQLVINTTPIEVTPLELGTNTPVPKHPAIVIVTATRAAQLHLATSP